MDIDVHEWHSFRRVERAAGGVHAIEAIPGLTRVVMHIIWGIVSYIGAAWGDALSCEALHVPNDLISPIFYEIHLMPKDFTYVKLAGLVPHVNIGRLRPLRVLVPPTKP